MPVLDIYTPLQNLTMQLFSFSFAFLTAISIYLDLLKLIQNKQNQGRIHRGGGGAWGVTESDCRDSLLTNSMQTYGR